MNPTPHPPSPSSLARPARYALLACTLLMAGWAQAQLAIQSLTAAAQGGGGELVRIQTNEPLRQLPAGFSMQAPARIALDIPGASNATGQNLFELNQGNLRSANVVQAGDRTRIVLNLSQPVGYELRIEGNTLLVQLQPPAARPAVAGGGALATTFAEGAARPVQALTDIDFRRGEQNTGRVLVELPSSQTGVDIRQQGRNLVLEFAQTSLPEGLRRRLDVSDFGTPVQTVTATQVGDRVRLVVEPTGNWEHSAFQTDRQFVLEVREVRPATDPAARDRAFTGEKITLDFQNIEVRAVLQVIADFTNINIVTSDAVEGSLTLRLRDVPWDQALDIVLHAKDLGMRKTGNVIWVAPNKQIIERERQELVAQVSTQALEPLRTQHFQLSFARAQDVQAQLAGTPPGASAATPPAAGGAAVGAAGAGAGAAPAAGAVAGGQAAPATAASRILSPRGSVNIDTRTNQIFVTDVPSGLERVTQYIQRIDVAVSQVLIEARIVEAEDTFGRSLGVRLGGADLRGLRGGDAGYRVGNQRIAFGGSLNGMTATTGQFVRSTNEILDAVTAANSSFVNMPARALSGVTPAALAATLFSPTANRFLNLEISALQAEGRGQLVSSPRLITTNQNAALIEQGVQIPFTTTSQDGTQTIFRNATLRLEVTPQVTPDGGVILNVQINKDSPGEVTRDGLTINTKRIQTQVLVENGGTVVIGGIFESQESNDVNQVPLLGDLPVLGHLFRSTSRSTDKRELLIFLTPRVLTTGTALR